jgi:hypothetical protein
MDVAECARRLQLRFSAATVKQAMELVLKGQTVTAKEFTRLSALCEQLKRPRRMHSTKPKVE